MQTEIGRGEMFVADDGGRWYVMQNIDFETDDGYASITTEYLADVHGYDTEEQASKALQGLSS